MIQLSNTIFSALGCLVKIDDWDADIDVVMNPASRPLELRIVTQDWLYRVAPGPRARADFRKLPGYDRAWNAAAIVSDQLRAGMGWSEDRAEELKAQGATTLPKEQPPTKP